MAECELGYYLLKIILYLLSIDVWCSNQTAASQLLNFGLSSNSLSICLLLFWDFCHLLVSLCFLHLFRSSIMLTSVRSFQYVEKCEINFFIFLFAQ